MSQELLKRYYALWREVTVMYEEWAGQYGLSSYELFILFSLWEKPEGCTQKELCDYWLFPKQTVHSILKNFSRQGYIAFQVRDEDRRFKTVCLTGPGAAFAGPVMERLQAQENRMLRRLGQDERESLLKNTALLIRYFKEGSEPCL